MLTMMKVANAVGIVLALLACNSTDAEPEPEVETARIVLGADTVLVDSDGTVSNGPITIGVGSTAFSVQWLKADGSIETLVDPGEYQLEVASSNPGIVVFTRASAFGGNLVGISVGSTTVDFQLFHVEEGHADFSGHPVQVIVN